MVAKHFTLVLYVTGIVTTRRVAQRSRSYQYYYASCMNG